MNIMVGVLPATTIDEVDLDDLHYMRGVMTHASGQRYNPIFAWVWDLGRDLRERFHRVTIDGYRPVVDGTASAMTGNGMLATARSWQGQVNR